MLDTQLSEYLNGLLEIAGDCSEWLGRSEIGVSAYTADGWEKAFCRHYRIKSFTPVPQKETFYQTLVRWLGGGAPKLSKAVTERITARLGEPVAVYRAADEDALLKALSSSEGGMDAFYFTEDAFFVAFRTHVLAFLMGNFD